MNVMDRIFTFLLSIVGIVVASMAIFFTANEHEMMTIFFELEGNMLLKAYIISGLSVLLLISIRLLYASIGMKKGMKGASIDQRTDFGDIQISLETVQNLVLKSAGKIQGIKELKVKVNVDQTGLLIQIKTMVDGEKPIPNLSEQMQKVVNDYVEEITGVPVAKVSVIIANITQTQTFSQRVE
ncbi:alkaline shock response membrane anchor protein AmaP [Longirhabdus pacifica]|uniref:alkaline shock response membrane anchor protein AmaP n=1 Tax=Longirhabdus pacifica TaxID=2305227 RepID=UPI001008D2AB|nr:alkaline shock response membrane anchor protein AmaP [Longirhabdus pacifica]